VVTSSRLVIVIARDLRQVTLETKAIFGCLLPIKRGVVVKIAAYLRDAKSIAAKIATY